MDFTVSDVIRLVLYVLATYRVTYLLWKENGPWDAVDWIRAKAGIHYIAQNVPIYTYGDAECNSEVTYHKVVPDKFFAKLLDCAKCLSLWVAPVAVVIWYFISWWPMDLVAIVLATSAVTILLIGKE